MPQFKYLLGTYLGTKSAALAAFLVYRYHFINLFAK